MPDAKLNDRRLLKLIDAGLPQAEAARQLGVSRQAVSKRLQDLRGRTTKAVVAEKISQVVERKIDTMGQLTKVNQHANEMLDLLMRWQRGEPEALRVLESQVRRVAHGADGQEEVVEIRMKDPRELALRCMAEIRGQLELQVKIFETLYSLKAAEEFQNEVLDAINKVAPNVRDRIIASLNQDRAIRSAVRWY